VVLNTVYSIFWSLSSQLASYPCLATQSAHIVLPRSCSLPGVVLRRRSRGTSRRCVALSHTAINDEIRAINEARLVAGQEKDSLGLLDGLAEAAAGEVDFAAVALLGVVAEPVLQERCAGGSQYATLDTALCNAECCKRTSMAPGTAN